MDTAGVEEMVVYFVEEGVGSVGRLEYNHMEKGGRDRTYERAGGL